jgi:hypothetical protein
VLSFNRAVINARFSVSNCSSAGATCSGLISVKRGKPVKSSSGFMDKLEMNTVVKSQVAAFYYRFTANKTREKILENLKSIGWKSLTLWECEPQYEARVRKTWQDFSSNVVIAQVPLQFLKMHFCILESSCAGHG